MINYYDILEVDRDASEEEIKRAYRKQVLRWHPDKNPYDAAAADRFLLVQQAYEHLSDYIRRSEYNDKLDGKYQEPVRVYYQPYTPPAEAAKAKKKKSLLFVIPVLVVLVTAIGLMVWLFVSKQDPVYVNTVRDSALPAAAIHQPRSISGIGARPQAVVRDSATAAVDSIFRSSLRKPQKVELPPPPDTKKVVKLPVRRDEPILEASYYD